MNDIKLSDQIQRKFIDTIDIDDWEVETDTGWAEVESVSKTIQYRVFEIKTETGKVFRCADDHILFDENFDEIFAKDTLNKKIVTKQGFEKVIKINELDCSENMYDLQINSSEHRFWTSEILSHNSTSIAAYMLHFVLFNPNKFCAILANKADSAREILGRIQLAYELLPFWLKQGVIDWNKGSFSLENGSKIIAAATSSSAIRGKSLSFLLLDEFAFVPKNMADEFFRSVYPTISSGKESKIAIISTPYGMNHYYKLWNEAVTGKNDYIPHLADWTCVPGRNEEWKIETIRNIGEEAFRQEFEVEFQGSSGTLISGTKLKSMTYRDPIFQDSDGLKIYYTPEKDHSYIMTVDVSEGTGLDFHAINVIDITDYPYQQVAVFRNQFLDTVLLPDAILSLGEKYNDAFVMIEINSIGQTVAEILFTDLEYEHLMFTTMSGRKGQVLGGGFSGKTQYGLKMTKQSKRIGCSLLKTLIENDQLIINDYDTYSELTTFVRNKGSYEAEVGCNDDSVMSLVSFAWITGQQYFKEDMEQDLRQNINRKVVDHLEEMLVPFGAIDDGTEYMSNEDLIRKSMEINYDDF